MIRLRVKDIVFEDLAEIKSYLHTQNANNYFIEFKDSIKKCYTNLKLFPLMGTEVKSRKFKQYRYILIDKYYVFYTFDDETVIIQTILHSARNYKRVLQSILPE